MKRSLPSWLTYIIVGLLIVAGMFFLTYQLPLVSATYDEGFSYLQNGAYLVKNFRWDVPYILLHPPLVYYLHGWTSLAFPTTDFEVQLLIARLVLISMYVLFALTIFTKTKQWYGAKAAFLALILYLFSPEILSHGKLITPDHILAFMIFLTLISLYEWFQKPTIKQAILTGVFFGLTFLTKYTALLLVPLSIILLGFYFLKKKIVKVIYFKQLLAIFAIAFFIIHAGFIFKESGRLPEVFLSQPFKRISTVPFAKPLLTVLFPRAYLEGVDFQIFESSKGVWWGYFNGEYYPSGLWYFYPAVFFIKTPIPILILSILAFWSHKKNKHGPHFLPQLILITVVFFFLYFMFFNKLLIGLRYLLPIYPLLFIYISPVVNLTQKKIGQTVLIGLLIWYVAGSVRITPHYLAYANEFIGGPKNLWKYVADSSLDWNQDQKFIAMYLKNHPEITIINPHQPTSGKIAVNVNDMNLYYFYDYQWLRNLKIEPVDYIGYTWLIFDIKPEDLKKN